MKATTKKTLRRVTVLTMVGLVGAIAMKLSYSHIEEVALIGGQSRTDAKLIPFLVDAPAVLATVLGMEDRLAKRNPRFWVKATVIACMVASLGANVVTNFVHDPTNVIGYAVAAWPAVALFLIVELLAHAEEKPVAKPRARTARKPATAKVAKLHSVA